MDLSRRRRPRPKDRLFGRVDRAQRFCRKYVVRRMRKLVRCMHRLITLTHAKMPESDNYRLRPPIHVSIYFDCRGKAPRPFPTRAYLNLRAATDASRRFHLSITSNRMRPKRNFHSICIAIGSLADTPSSGLITDICQSPDRRSSGKTIFIIPGLASAIGFRVRVLPK
jgi:hypothetical protein